MIGYNGDKSLARGIFERPRWVIEKEQRKKAGFIFIRKWILRKELDLN